MRFTMKVGMDNEAFVGAVEGPEELARILRHVANDVEAGHLANSLRDVNGNTVGSWEVETP